MHKERVWLALSAIPPSTLIMALNLHGEMTYKVGSTAFAILYWESFRGKTKKGQPSKINIKGL
jgi:hypothetical protein